MNNTVRLVRKYNEMPNGDPGGMRCEWLVIGPPHGAVQYVEFRYPEGGKVEQIMGMNRMAADLGYHSVKPQYEGQPTMNCHVIEGACYYDGSSLNAEHVKELFDKEGEEALWKYLEIYFNEMFLRETL